MIGNWLQNYRPSLRRWSRGFAITWLIIALLAAPIAVSLLDQIYQDANTTYSNEIPALLDRNRNAVKLERLSSFIRAIATSNDAKIERNTFVQLQTLAQGFDFETDVRLTDGAHRVVAIARKIVALRAAHRAEGAKIPAADGPARPDAGSANVGQAEQQLGNQAIALLASLIDDVTTDAALRADNMASRIQRNAGMVKDGCFAALALFIAFGVFLFWFFQIHVLRPIAAAVHGLEAVSTPEKTAVLVPRTRFSELDMIGRSVEQYAKFVAELQTANSALHTLSNQDGLTGLPNRRSFDLELGEACEHASEGFRPFGLLLIDIDHFKLLNDRMGHLAGDQCLQQVGFAIQKICARQGFRAARYGGEEFAIVLADVSAEQVYEVAQQIRSTITRIRFEIEDAHCAIDVTVSVGVTHRPSGTAAFPDQVIREADEALYLAKRSGRNRVCTFDGDRIALSRAS